MAGKKISIKDIRDKFPMYADLSDDQLLIGVRQKFYPEIPMGEFVKHVEYTAPDPTEGMSTGAKLVAGYGKAGADIVRGVGQFVGAVSREDVAEARKRDAALMNTGAGMTGNVLGNLAALAPTALIPGAATIRGGAAIGAAAGAIQPSTSTGETLGNITLGGVAGAAVPAAVRTYQAGRAAAEPFYDAGRQAILGRALNRAAGNDAPAVAQRLREAGTPFVGPSAGVPRTVMGEFVPGSVPTVGQASGNAGVAAMERAAIATNPEVTNAATGLFQAQNAARVGVLDDMAGRTSGARDFFAAARDATANQLYGNARAAGIDPARLTPQVQQELAALSQRIPNEVIEHARQLARIRGDTMTDATSVQGLHWVKQAIDDLIGQSTRSGNNTMRAAYTGLQTDLLNQLDNLSPAYGEARRTFAAMSQPLNQMDVAQELVTRSVDPLTGNLRPAAFARNLTDATAARATGRTGATLDGTMAPAQRNALHSILLDVQRSNAAQNVGRGPGSDTVQKLAYTNMLDQAGVPTFLRDFAPAQIVGNIGSRGADLAYGRANRELSNRLAEVMLDPGQAAELMFLASRPAQAPVRNALMRSASGLALSAPALANGQKQ